MIKRIVSLVTLLLVMLSAQAQDKVYKQLFQNAQEYMLYEDYEKALNTFLQIEKKGMINSNVAFSIGLCYMNIENQNKQAIPYLERASANTSPSYKENNYKEEAAPNEAWFYLGKAYRLVEQYDKAIRAYREFKSKLSVTDIYYHDFMNLQINACQMAKDLMENPVNVEIEKPNFVGSTNCFHPAVSGDEKTIVYTSYQEVRDPYTGEKDFFDLIFYSTRNDDGSWSKPIDITYDIASDGNFTTASLSYHGDMLILYRDDFGNGNLYFSTLQNGRWTEIEKFSKIINSKYNETHGSLSKDGKTLFFVSDRPGGYGGMDIYRSFLDSKGNWGTAVNLGEVVNTPYDEPTAFLADDGETLYFASEGHSSMGGFDIFKSVCDQNGNWSKPQNLGYPINSPYDDTFYAPIGNGTTGYMDRYNDNHTLKQIFKVSPPYVAPAPNSYAQNYSDPSIDNNYNSDADNTNNDINSDNNSYSEPSYTPTYPSIYYLKGRLTLQDNKELDPSFYVHITNNDNEIVAVLSPNTTTGEFSTTIMPGSYKVSAFGDGYEPADAYIYISSQELNPEVLTFVNMIPTAVSSGEYYSIKSILFDDNSSKLNRDAQIEVERLAVLMDKNPDLRLEVAGNTDDLGTDDYNQRLSYARAREVVNYLSKKGIAESRFITKGLGKTNFIAINQNPDGSDNPEGRALNRRVDLKVLNPTNANITVENIYVPDALKYRDQLTYTIWITESDKPLSPAKFKNINNVWIFPRENGGYLYTVGLFKHQAEAIKMIGNVIDAGFADAHLISSLEYNQIIQKGSSVYKSKMADPDVNTYTIQLLAVKEPVAKSRFRGLFDVEMHKGTDGLYRYYWGEFIGKISAKQALDDILSKGFIDAFIVNTEKFN